MVYKKTLTRKKKKKEIPLNTLKKITDGWKVGTMTYHTTTSKKKKRISKNTAYKRGRAFEYRVKKHFEKNGYYVVRKYASKGAEDLIAIRAAYALTHEIKTWTHPIDGNLQLSEVLLIQCKNLKVERPLKKEDKDRLKKLAKQCGATPLLATNPSHKLHIVEVD